MNRIEKLKKFVFDNIKFRSVSQYQEIFEYVVSTGDIRIMVAYTDGKLFDMTFSNADSLYNFQYNTEDKFNEWFDQIPEEIWNGTN